MASKGRQMEIFDDLEAEEDALEAVLAGLSEADWERESAAAGWTVADTVLHLAQSEEAVVLTTGSGQDYVDWHPFGDSVDSAMAARVEQERAGGEQVFARWREARRAALRGLRAADPGQPVRWVAAALKPRTLATTRLAEHWAHALDIVGPLGIDYPDTARLRHIAWLGWSTLPYAFALAGAEPATVYCELTGPDGEVWRYGTPDADSTISGPAGAFCRVGAQRLAPPDSGLHATGPHGAAALRVLRNYAQ
jgi:uncharacterized protein (TIGR03084 family)